MRDLEYFERRLMETLAELNAMTKERDELKAEYAQLDKLYGKTRDERDNCKADILGLNDELEKFKAAHEYLPVIDVRRIGEIILQNKETKAENELLRQAARPLVHERLVKANDELAAWREQAEKLAAVLERIPGTGGVNDSIRPIAGLVELADETLSRFYAFKKERGDE